MSGIILTFCAFGLGALAVLALPPFSMPVLLPVAFGALYLLTVGESRMRAGLAGWAFGVGYFLFGLSWIAESFFVDPERLAWMAVPAVAGLAMRPCAVPSGGNGSVRMEQDERCLRRIDLRGLLVGFGMAARHHADRLPLEPYCLHVGRIRYSTPNGRMGWQLRTWPPHSSAVGPARNAPHAESSAKCVRRICFHVGGGGAGTLGTVRLMATTPPTDTTVRTVQGNILQTEKWDPAFRDRNISRYLDLSAQSGSFDVLLWPESAFPGYLDENPEMLDQIAERLPEGRVLLTGAQTRESAGTGTRYRNSILAVDQTGRIVTRYAKHHLVPFGEYVPLRGFLPLQRLTIGLGDFTPGPGPQTVELPGLSPVGLSICYEAIFPGRVVDAASRPDWIFNATNDAWFGASLGPRQHLASARMRAVEEGLPMVRAANTGISAVIDGYGRIVARLGLDETGFLDARLPAALPATSFAKYGQMMFLLVLAACIAGAIGLTIGKEKAP